MDSGPSASSSLPEGSDLEVRNIKLIQLQTAVCAWVSAIARARAIVPRRAFGLVLTPQEETCFADESDSQGIEQGSDEPSPPFANVQESEQRAVDRMLIMLRKPASIIGPVVHVGLFYIVTVINKKLIRTGRTYLNMPVEQIGDAHTSIRMVIEDEDGRAIEAYVLDIYLHVPANSDSDSVRSGNLRTGGFVTHRYEELVSLCNALQTLCQTFPQLGAKLQPRFTFFRIPNRDSPEHTNINRVIVPNFTHMTLVFNKTIIVTQWRLVTSIYVLSSDQIDPADVV